MTVTDIRQTPDLAPLARFAQTLTDLPDIVADLHADQIGLDASIDGPFGRRKLVYADYVASGRALALVEDFVRDRVLPYYANSHTEASFCGGYMTRLREAARQVILQSCGGNSKTHAVIFAGSGATAGLNRLVYLFGIGPALAQGQQPHILVGPYEHHSNLLPWRESGARVIEINEAATGGPDLAHLKEVLAKVSGKGPVIAAFSAASNVTGVISDTGPVTRLVKAAGGRMVWDFAGGGPYLPVDMDDGVDAIVMSAHKFIGGPGASGVLVLRRDAVRVHVPSNPGGGTVAFVNRTVHDYSPRLEEREEGGTPNIIGDIRAALVIMVKDAVGQAYITRRNQELSARTFAAWQGNRAIQILAPERRQRLPIFSFVIRDEAGALVDYTLFTRLLSDKYGIQARGGCACAGPYVHRLLNINDAWSNRLRAEILSGDDSHKPGFIRLNLSYLMADSEVDFILNSVLELAANITSLAAAKTPDSGRTAAE